MKAKDILFGILLAVFGLALVIYSSQDTAAADDPNASLAADGTSVTIDPSPGPAHVAPSAGDPTAAVVGTIDCTPQHRAPFLEPIAPPSMRRPVTNPNDFPSRVHLMVQGAVAPLCTGWLIADNVVVTAGHCLNDMGSGAWAPIKGPFQMCVGYQVRQAGASQYCGVKRLYSTNGWVNHKDQRYDYGAIALTCDVGKRLGHLGYGWTTARLMDRTTSISGYFESRPGSVPCTERRLDAIAYFLCRGSDRVVGQFGGQLFVGLGTGFELGTSGAPMILAGSPMYAAAITTNQRNGSRGPQSRFNYGVVISQRVFQNLVAWSKAR